MSACPCGVLPADPREPALPDLGLELGGVGFGHKVSGRDEIRSVGSVSEAMDYTRRVPEKRPALLQQTLDFNDYTL
jgi:hypothetical protein